MSVMPIQQPQQISSVRKPSLMATMATRYGIEPEKFYETLKGTVFKEASNEQLMMLCMVANEYQLNPFLREIYAFKDSRGNGIVPIVGIDGWLKIINSQPEYDGMEIIMSEDGKSCTCTIYRKDRSRPTSATEYYEECFRGTDTWKKYPRRMLRNRAIIQCARIAFGFTGISDDNDADIISSSVVDVQPSENPVPVPVPVNLQRQVKEKAAKARQVKPEPAPIAETVQEENAESSELEQKLLEIEQWIQDGCEVRDDYLSALQMLKNFVSDGKLKEEWLPEAEKTVKDVAARNGIKL